jgi:tetratricopeptide (TPR) repeat protein
MVLSGDTKQHLLAEKYFDRILQLGKERDFDYDLQYNTIHVGQLYLMVGKFDMAKKYLDAAHQFTDLEPNLIPKLKALEAGCRKKSYGECQKIGYQYMLRNKKQASAE